MSAKFLKSYIRDVMKYKGIMKGTYTAWGEREEKSEGERE